MKKTILKSSICILMCIVMTLVSSLALISSADGTHGFFMTCNSKVTNGKSDGFMIDFYSDSENALCTYWSNANWSMYTVPTVKKFKYIGLTGGGAYAGLQLRSNVNDRTGIMSMWRYEYRDLATNSTKYIYAKAIYGKTTTYDNEGSGTSCVMPFNWKNNQWYRELLYCWQDAETGYTFIGTWFYDYEADEWTLFAYYNTFLVDSYIQGDIGQFLENYVESTRENYRSFRYRNIYFLSNETGEWISSPKVNLRSDANEKAHGEAKLGVSDDGTYVWASVDGRSSVDTDELLQIYPTLVQTEKPIVGEPKIDTFKVVEGNDRATISWSMTKGSTPQLSYKVVITDGEGNEIASKYETRPEVSSVVLNDLGTDNYKCEITVTDVFGKTTTTSYTSKNYGVSADETETPAETTTPSATVDATTPEPTATGENDDKTEIFVVIAIIAVAAVLFGLAAFIVIKKAKSRKK